MRHRLSNIALLVASLLFIELVLRLFDPIVISHFAAVRDYANALEFGAPWGYLHKPGYSDRIQGVDIAINEYGLRGPSTARDKPAGTTRLLILGDSVVFGWGAPQDSIFPARLDRQLAARNPAIEVIGAGVASWNTRTQFEWLRARGIQFQPDVLVMMVVGNDADPIYVGNTDVARDSLMGATAPGYAFQAEARGAWQHGYQNSRILAYLQFARVFFRQRNLESAGYAPSSPQWRDTRLALDGIIHLCAAHEIELVVFLYGDEERIQASGVLRAYRDYLTRRGVTVHALPAALFNQRRYRNSVVDGHENAAGHAVLANAIRPALEPFLPAND
jgi:lysophospholipase L1-like esterase